MSPYSSRWVRNFLITIRFSMQMMILIAPPQVQQVPMSRLNMYLKPCDQALMPAARRAFHDSSRGVGEAYSQDLRLYITYMPFRYSDRKSLTGRLPPFNEILYKLPV